MVHEQLVFLYDNFFTHSKAVSWDEVPYRDEPFVKAWEEYIRDIPRQGVLAALSQRLVQLRFPVMEGMSTDKNKEVYSSKGKYEMLLRLAKTNLIELASDDAEKLILSR